MINGKGILCSLKAALIGILSSLVLLAVFCFIAVRCSDPDFISPILSYAARLIGSAVTGFASVKFSHENGWISGLMSGALYVFVMISVSIFGNGESGFLFVLIASVAMLAVSTLFGGIGTPHKMSNNARRKALLKKTGFSR